VDHVGPVTRPTAVLCLLGLAAALLVAGADRAAGAPASEAGGPTRKTTAKTSTSADRTAPTKPGRLSVVSTTAASVTISWKRSSDRQGIAGYTIYRDGTRIGSTAATTTRYTASELTCGKSYKLGVQAYDLGGNRSAVASVVAPTSACVDAQPPSAPASVSQIDVTASSVTVAWAASTDDFGVVGYEVLRDGTVTGSTAAAPYALTALECGTMYTVGVRAFDAAGNRSSASSVLVTSGGCPDTTSPSAPPALALSSADQSSISVRWQPSSDAGGVIGYGVYRGSTYVGSTGATSYTVSGLSCGSNYTIAVDAYDGAGNRSGRSSISGATSACPPPVTAPPADTTAPTAPASLAVTGATAASISLRWTASTDDTAVAGYALYRDDASVGSVSLTSATFSGLTCGRSYQLGVEAFDASGNRSGRSSVVSSTAPCPDTTPPSTPSGLTQTSVTESAVGVGWTASSDNVGVAGYGIYLAGVRIASASSPGYTIAALTCGTTYTVGVDAYDAVGSRSAQATLVVATRACPVDAEAPTVPQNQTLAGITQSSFTMSWSAATDNVGVVGYAVYLDGARRATTTGTSYTYTGLACGTSYTLGVDAYDAAGNRSARRSLTSTTSACPASSTDTQRPSVPQGLGFGTIAETTAALVWNASTDNVGVTGYRLSRNGVNVATVTSPGYTYTGLTCGTAYSFMVEAYDAAGNFSIGAEAVASTSTVACSGGSTPPPPPAGSANVYLSPSGSDSAACTATAPCRSFARAYSVAVNGAVVSVGAGAYGSQFFAGGFGGSQSPGTKQLTFRGEPGNAVRQLHFGSPNLTFDGVNVDAGGAQLGSSDGATFENGGEPFTFKNGSIGNVVDQKGAMIDGPGMVFDNVRFHDVVIRTSGVHSECIFASVPEGMLVRNSTFDNCAVMDIFFVYPDWWSPLPAPYGNVVLEGNTFGKPDGTYTLYIAKIGLSIPSSEPVNGWQIRNNSFGSAVNIDAPIGTGNTFCGNTGSAPTAWKTTC
jgi:chitodextrinase